MKFKAETKIDINEKTVTADPETDKMNMFDDSIATGWGYLYGDFKIDLLSEYEGISKFRWYFSPHTAGFQFKSSTNVSDYTVNYHTNKAPNTPSAQ